MTVLVRTFLLSGLVVTATAPAFAQAPQGTLSSPDQSPVTSPAAPPANAVDPRKPAVLSFETNLREAVDLAGQRMTERAYQIAPVQIVQTRAATVTGVPLEGFGYHFTVQIPAVSGSGLMMLEMALKNQQQLSPGPIWAPSRNVSQTAGAERVGANVVAPDPVSRPPVTEASLNKMYTDFVKDALVDTIVDTAGVLILADADRLVVTARGDDVLTNQLERLNTRQLMLTIKGVDLNLLRSGKITRDQVRDRIEVKAF